MQMNTQTSKKQLSVLITYPHQGARQREELIGQLQVQKNNGRIEVWYDGLLRSGDSWEPLLVQTLEKADVVVLLLSKSSFGPDCSTEQESKGAQEQHDQNEGMLYRMLVDANLIDQEAFFSTLQIFPSDRKPMSEVVPQEKRTRKWSEADQETVAGNYRNNNNQPVTQILLDREDVLNAEPVASKVPRSGHVAYGSVGAFWRDIENLERLEMATVRGTFSKFAPFHFGSSHAKQRIHKEFLRHLNAHPDLLQENGLALDAFMSVSAGQMVTSRTTGDQPVVPLGLFDGIVRNSIPLFASREYFEAKIVPLLQEAGESASFEAEVTGRVVRRDNSFIRGFYSRQRLDKVLSEEAIASLCDQAYTLELDGPPSHIKKLPDPPRFLDGDIWLAYRTPEGERFLTGITNITDAADRGTEMAELERRVGSVK
jgi:hypothetical protein